MYPTLYHALLDLTGIDLPLFKFLNSFGFFVALAFVAASWLLSRELKRNQAMGLLKSTTRTVIIGEPARPLELAIQGMIGFLLGWKGLGLVFDFTEATQDPQAFLLSGRGSFLAGLVLAAFFIWTRWREKEKHRLKEPRQETITVEAHQQAGTITLLAALWGLVGAKLFHWLENPGEFMEFISGPSGSDIFSGLTMYGGLIVAAIMVVRYMVRHGIPAFIGMDSAAPGLMLAYAIGRIGCHVSGDGDWGIANTATAPSWIPDWLWTYGYPNNVIKSGEVIADGGTCFPGYCTVLDPPVYPTPLYEAIVCTALFFVLWGLRKRLTIPGLLFAVYLVLNGIERFFIEKIRVNVKLAGGWTQAEIIAVMLVLLGVGGWFWLSEGVMQLQALTEQVAALCADVASFIRDEGGRFSEHDVESKSHNNLVSYVDKGAEERLVAGLSKLLPGSGFIAEEGTGARGANENWIIDPLDGTTNFVHGIPCYCISVGLEREGSVVLGVVLEITRDERFSAWKGGGARLNGSPIQVSQRSRLQDSLLATGFPYDDFGREAQYMQLLRELMHASRGIRRLGSAAADLAYVACGRFEAFYEYGLNPWDVAAGALIVQEAGGQVTDFQGGGDWLTGEEIVASNGLIHPELLGPIGKFFAR